MAILSGDGLDSGGTTYEAQEEDTTTSTSSTSAWEDSIDNKVAAVIDEQTSGSGNYDEQVQGGTTTADIIGDVTTNPDVTQELVTMTTAGDAQQPQNTVQETVQENIPDAAGFLEGLPIGKILVGGAIVVGLLAGGD